MGHGCPIHGDVRPQYGRRQWRMRLRNRMRPWQCSPKRPKRPSKQCLNSIQR
jgi:hypothetical protein